MNSAPCSRIVDGYARRAILASVILVDVEAVASPSPVMESSRVNGDGV
jgi:hypothetical protein